MPVFQSPGSFRQVSAEVYLQTPSSVTPSGGALTLDVGQKNDFQVAALTANVTISFTGHTPGNQGFIGIRQQSTGTPTFTVTFTPPGSYTLMNDSAAGDLVAATGANSVTLYFYLFATLGSTNFLILSKMVPV